MTIIKFTPKEIFYEILKWSVIPTFDLVIRYGNRGVFIVKRSIAPYQNQWALPGLRMFKPESINDTLKRIAKNEIGLKIDPNKKFLLGQYVGKFKAENERQDLSTGYLVNVNSSQKFKINPDHFSDFKIINSKTQIPGNMGAMYKYYLNIYFDKQYFDKQ
jgi:ADP-ribose pyrophosphatase YjhB (NUDIX family)